jgi:hypothetical protein
MISSNEDSGDTVGGTRVDPADGLLEARNPVKPATSLQDPRVPAWADQVAAERRRLRAAYSAPEAQRVIPTSKPLTAQIYKYSRGADLTNDEMGYGERGEEVLWSVHGKELKPEKRTIQRTKSGRQVLTRP